MIRTLLPVMAGCTLLLNACAGEVETGPIPMATRSGPAGPIPAGEDPFAPGSSLTRTDAQGAVVVDVTPLDLMHVSDEIAFEVSMNTHSIDLGMDLATLASLSTDTGFVLQALAWDAPVGGHHVSGRLIFPAMSDGVAILAGATRLTLEIKGVDAATRVFSWSLQ